MSLAKISILLLSMFMLTPLIAGETAFVTDRIKMAIYSAPSLDAKMLTNVPSDTKLKVITANEEWSKIRTEYGDEGWALNKLISTEFPVRSELIKLEKKYLDIEVRYRAILDRFNQVERDRKTLSSSLLAREQELAALKIDYDELVQSSNNVIQLQQDYKKAMLQMNDYYVKSVELEKKANEFYVLWLCAGATILIVGIVFGRISRRTSGYSSNLRF